MEPPIVVASVVCPGCGAAVPRGSLRCSTCGRVGPAPYRPVVDSRWQLLLLLFGAMGVLGLPLLWSSRAFGLGAKLVLSLLVTIWTALLVGLCWWCLTWSWERLAPLWEATANAPATLSISVSTAPQGISRGDASGGADAEKTLAAIGFGERLPGLPAS